MMLIIDLVTGIDGVGINREGMYLSVFYCFCFIEERIVDVSEEY